MNRILAGAAAGVLLFAHVHVSAQVQWDRPPHMSPPRHELECARNTHVVDRQTRREIEHSVNAGGASAAKKTGNMTDFMNEVARRIAGMQSVGYVASGAGDNAVYTLNLPMRIVYTRPLEFRARPDNDGVTFGVVRGKSGHRVAVNHDAKRYMKPGNAKQVDQKTAEFVREMDAQTENIRQAVHEKRFDWDAKEDNALRRGGKGTFVRLASYRFCGQTYRVAVNAGWRAPVAHKK
jgi:hypothetical protein